MHPDDTNAIESMRKILKKTPTVRFFVASKTGGNAKGAGADRSVILSSVDGKTWRQWHKVWGKDNTERARKIISLGKVKVCQQNLRSE